MAAYSSSISSYAGDLLPLFVQSSTGSEVLHIAPLSAFIQQSGFQTWPDFDSFDSRGRPVSLWALCILTHSFVVKFTERLCLESESTHSALVRSYPSLPQRTGHGWHQRQRVTSEKLCSRVQTHCSNFTALLRLLPNLSECSRNVMKKFRHVCTHQIFQLQTSGDNFIGAVCFSPPPLFVFIRLFGSISISSSPYLSTFHSVLLCRSLPLSFLQNQ